MSNSSIPLEIIIPILEYISEKGSLLLFLLYKINILNKNVFLYLDSKYRKNIDNKLPISIILQNDLSKTTFLNNMPINFIYK